MVMIVKVDGTNIYNTKASVIVNGDYDSTHDGDDVVVDELSAIAW